MTTITLAPGADDNTVRAYEQANKKTAEHVILSPGKRTVENAIAYLNTQNRQVQCAFQKRD